MTTLRNDAMEHCRLWASALSPRTDHPPAPGRAERRARTGSRPTVLGIRRRKMLRTETGYSRCSASTLCVRQFADQARPRSPGAHPPSTRGVWWPLAWRRERSISRQSASAYRSTAWTATEHGNEARRDRDAIYNATAPAQDQVHRTGAARPIAKVLKPTKSRQAPDRSSSCATRPTRRSVAAAVRDLRVHR